MLARRLIATRARRARERDLNVTVSHVAATTYVPPLPAPDGSSSPEWDGMMTIGADGAPLWVPRPHNGFATRAFAATDRAPPGSHAESSIPLRTAAGAWAAFPAAAQGIDPAPLETFPFGQAGEWARQMVATATGNTDGQNVLVRNARTNATRQVDGTRHKWINTGEGFVAVQELLNPSGSTSFPPSIRYQDQGLVRTFIGGSVGSMLELPSEGLPRLPDVVTVRDVDQVETKALDLHTEIFEQTDVLIRKSTTLQTGLGLFADNQARVGGRHYSIATLVTVDVRRTPFGDTIDDGGRPNYPCILKIRVSRRTGVLTVHASGTVSFSPIRIERYALDQAAWWKEVQGNRLFRGFTIAGTNDWPTLPTNIPVAILVDGPVPTVTRPVVMSDRLIQIVGSDVRAWAFDGTYLGTYAIPSGITGARKLDRTDLLVSNGQWTSRDRGATWQQYAAGQTVVTSVAATSVCLY